MAVEDIVIRMSVEGEEELAQMLKISGMSMRQFNKHLNSNALLMNKNNQVIDKLSGKQLKLGNVMRQGMYQARRFKMEWLSIMFAGMALSRAFGGLIKTQMQLWGVTEGFASMWTVVFLPIMEKITPFLWKLIDAFMALDPGVQKAIGALIILLAVLGTILMVVGQVFLGIMGFKLLLGKKGLSGVVVALKGFLTGLGAAFLWIAAIVAVVVIGMYLAWKTNFLNMKQTVKNFIDGFKQTFQGVINVIKGILKVIRGIFTGDFELVKKGIIQIFKGLWNFLIGGFKMAFNLIAGIIKGALMIVYNIIKVIVDAVLWIADKAVKLVGGKGIEWRMPSLQTGGLVTQTGPALLHRGERVIPKGRAGGGEVMFAPTVYISATITNEMDIRLLATKLNEFWVKDFERIAQTRGI